MIFGAIASLHTFGRPLDWNPHIHVLVCEDAYDSKDDKIKNFSYMDYKNFARHGVINYSAILTDTLATTKNFKALKAGSTENTRKGSMSMLQKSKMNRLRTTLKNVFNI